MSATSESKRLRCAVYTRKSTEEGLAEQEYTSIDAQRDAGQAYIASHAAEGWVAVADAYDDGGWSGGTLVRPAMQRLLADIAAGRIDVVVVYKLDRLTRSLFDFADLAKQFEATGVTIVSVTQYLNTTNAMGRMLLNILLTFAQFEREQTAERIRDKFAASKQKGLWMHGVCPLGYDVIERRLVPNAVEAEQVRFIFEQFVEHGTMLKVVQALHARGWCTKAWTNRAGHHRPGRRHDKSTVHSILHNRAYLGELKSRHHYFPGTHPPLIERALWDQVQALLSSHPRTRTRGETVDFLLRGRVFDIDGRAMTTWYTRKRNGRCYRYYLSTRELHEGKGASPLPRLPAAELEAAVIDQLRRVLRAPELVAAVIPQAIALDSSLDAAQVVVAMTQVERIWDQLFPAEQQRLVQLLIERVVISSDALTLHLHACGLTTLTSEFQREQAA